MKLFITNVGFKKLKAVFMGEGLRCIAIYSLFCAERSVLFTVQSNFTEMCLLAHHTI